jgi:hypothetical protein
VSLTALLNLWPPFAPGASEPGPEPEPVTDDFLTALRTRLREADGLEELSNVYLESAPQAAAAPFLVVNPLGTTAFENNSDSHYEEASYQFDVLARDAAQAKRLGLAAYEALQWDRTDPLLFVEGYEMSRHRDRPVGPRREGSGWVGGRPVWRWRFDVNFLIGVD